MITEAIGDARNPQFYENLVVKAMSEVYHPGDPMENGDDQNGEEEEDEDVEMEEE